MSFQAKSPSVQDRQLKVQEMVVTANEKSLYDPNGGNGKFTISEPLKQVLCVLVHDDSVPGVISFAQSAIAISGSGSDAIVVTGLALAANDVAIVKYIVQE